MWRSIGVAWLGLGMIAPTAPAAATGTLAVASTVAGKVLDPPACDGYYPPATCRGLTGNIDTQSGAGSTAATSSTTSAFNSGLAETTGQAHAAYDRSSVETRDSFTGFGGPLVLDDSSTGAEVTDVLDVKADAVTGYIVMGFIVSGAMSGSDGATGRATLAYQLGDQPDGILRATTAFSAEFSANYLDVFATADVSAPDTTAFAGFTTTGASLSGSGIVTTAVLPITFGQPTDWFWALYANSHADSGMALSDFTASLSSIAVTDAAGRPIDFSITAASGTLYDATGAHPAAVPEPGPWVLMLAGFGFVGTGMRRRRAARA